MKNPRERAQALPQESEAVPRRALASVLGSLGLFALTGCTNRRDTGEALPEEIGRTSRLLVAAAPGTVPAMVFMDNGNQNSEDGPLYDKVTGALTLGGGFRAGVSSTMDSPPSYSLGAGHELAQNAGSFVAGASCTASSSWCVAMGYLSKATAAGAVAIGEELKATAPNTLVMGFGSSASGTYSVAIGCGAEARGAMSQALGGAVTRNYGEFSQASCANGWNAEGWHAVDQYARASSGATVALLLGDGTELVFPPQQLFSIRVRLMGITDDHSKYAHEVWDFLLFLSPAGEASIAQPPVKVAGASSAGTNGFSDCGWTSGPNATAFVTSGNGYAGGTNPAVPASTLRITCQPADRETVQFCARVEWTVLAY